MREMPDIIILCGGAGTRLRSVTGESPKSLAAIGGRPFMDVLLEQAAAAGARRVILAVGYRSDAIEAFYGSASFGLELVYSREESPLGTGGALARAARQVRTSDCIAMNGDSYTNLDLRSFAEFYEAGGAAMSVVVTPVDGRTDTGSVLVDSCGRIERFEEKTGGSAARHNNAGIYELRRELLLAEPADAAASLERELIPRWLAAGQTVLAYQHSGRCTDIGTPERYAEAQGTLSNAGEIDLSWRN